MVEWEWRTQSKDLAFKVGFSAAESKTVVPVLEEKRYQSDKETISGFFEASTSFALQAAF